MLTTARSRRFRFRLNVLFAVITLTGLALAWIGNNYRRARSQEEAIRELAALPLFLKHEPIGVPGVTLFEEMFGSDFCSNVTEVVYPGSSFAFDAKRIRLPNGEYQHVVDESASGGRRFEISAEAYKFLRSRHRRGWSINTHLVHLVGLPNLERLDLKHSGLSGPGLQHVGKLRSLKTLILSDNALAGELSALQGLKNLEVLDLTDTGIDDAGLFQLRGLVKLRVLQLDRARISDEGLKSLRAFPKLRELSLCGVKGVTDRGLVNVGSLVHLTSLNLYGTKLTNDGLNDVVLPKGLKTLDLRKTIIDSRCMPQLASLRDLEILHLADTKIDDRGLEHLSRLSQLRWLDVSFCQVTDVGLRHLSRMPNLKSLTIEGTAMSSDGIREFCEDKPECEVRRIVFH